MNRENARQYIRQEWRQLIADITSPAKNKVNGETSYICPICGHGKGGDGLARNPKSKDGSSLHCFGCNFSGDIIDLYQKHTGAAYNDALAALAGRLGIAIDATDAGSAAHRAQPSAQMPAAGQTAPAEPEADYTPYFNACAQRITDPAALAYLQARGISLATAQAYGLGYDPEADPARNPGGSTGAKLHSARRLIIPTGRAQYVARAIDPAQPLRYANPTGSGAGLFNLDALKAAGTVFITEGAFDALAIIEAGAPAIGLNSTSNARALLEHIKAMPAEARPGCIFAVCTDNDEPGRKAAEELYAGFKALSLPAVRPDICGSHNDPNEALTADPEAFRAAVQDAQRQAARPDSAALYIARQMGEDIETFKQDIKTGFAELDRQAGGLYAGLYCLAAISSLGKTTFAAQIADQIAASGQDVLYFSLEQSRLEMVSKSLSRTMAKRDIKQSVTSLAIRKGRAGGEALRAAAAEYMAAAERLSIIEGNFSCTPSFILDYIQQYIKRTGARPVVFIDYLQIVQPDIIGGRRPTAKEAVDDTITGLKRISRDLNTPIIVICSLNRSNYTAPLDFASLKESGNIEYTCDVVYGLQPEIISTDEFDELNDIQKRAAIKEAKKPPEGQPRKIELVCLKNRYGISSFSCYYDYFSACDLFIERSGRDPNPFKYIKAAPRKAGRKL